MIRFPFLLACLSLTVCVSARPGQANDEDDLANRDTPGDFDGDGDPDQARWSSDGLWTIDLASDGFGLPNIRLTGCGDRSMSPEAVDVDGDGLTDLRLRVSATDALVDLAADGFGRWNQHEVAIQPSAKRIRLVLTKSCVSLLEQADVVVPGLLELPRFDVVDGDADNESVADNEATGPDQSPAAEGDSESPDESSAEGETPSTDTPVDGVDQPAESERVTIVNGPPLNEAERSLLRRLLLADDSYVFGVQKRRPFIPTHSFHLQHAGRQAEVLADSAGAQLLIRHDDRQWLLNCDGAVARLRLLLDRIIPDKTSTDEPDKEPQPCDE